MNHKYRLSDFKRILEESDTDINERIITVDLSNLKELPEIIIQKLEVIVNKMIAEYEQENNIIIPLENMDLENCITVDTDTKELLLEVFIGYDVSKGLLHRKEVITAADEHYDIIRKFFFNKLNDYVSEQIRRIEKCVQ